jgi:hypothetical protein
MTADIEKEEEKISKVRNLFLGESQLKVFR